jgi:biotin carboxyl carrier protein
MTKETQDNKQQDYITFVVHTAKYRTLPTKKYNERKQWTPYNPKLVIAKIPGLVHKFYVKPNQKVKKGDILLELEAMKMYNKIFAHEDGTVNKIHVTQGQRVPKNTVLIELK